MFHFRDFGLEEVRFLSPQLRFRGVRRHADPDGPPRHLPAERKRPIAAGFVARWDGGNRYGREQFDLDIDMVNAGEDEIAKFRRDQDGYTGHHAVRTTDPTGHHRYEVTITTPLSVVFDATCSFTLHRQVSITVKAEARVWYHAQVVRASPES